MTPGRKHANKAWQYLRLYNYYRGALSLFFLTLYLNSWTELFIRSEVYNPVLFYWASITYVASCLAFMFTVQLHRPPLDAQVILHTCVDVMCIIALMHASGGIRSGIGMLLVINVSMTSLFLNRRMVLLFAAATSLALLSEHIYSQVVLASSYKPAYGQAGILGLLIFGFATATSIVARRLRESEQLVSERSKELKTAVQMNEHIIQSMRTGIMVVDSGGRIEMANNAAANLLGTSRLESGASLNAISVELYKRFIEWQRGINTSNSKPLQQSHGLPDLQLGFSRIDPVLGSVSATLLFLEDASQLNQRFQQVRLASLGRLTASIAHEIRNPLAAIHHAAQLLGESDIDIGDRKLTGIINTQAQRLNSIVENVLQLSRQQRGSPESIPLLQWLEQFRVEWVASQALQPDQLRIRIEPPDTRILFDSSHLHQVMWNLCGNAIRHTDKPTDQIAITIRGGVSQDSPQPFIDIIDNGPGIDADTAQQIFDPFFTTSTEGTGLGLYISKEVIESNRAKIRHIALPTGGTCFRIYFLQATDAGISDRHQQQGDAHE